MYSSLEYLVVREQLRWYWRFDDEDRSMPFQYLSAMGLALAHPVSGLARHWEDGDVHELTVQELFSQLGSSMTVDTQLWLSGDVDVFTTVEPVATDIIATEFDMDGLTWGEAHRVMAALVALTLTFRGSIGLVAQPYLEEVLRHWDRYFVEKLDRFPEDPDLIVEESRADDSWQFKLRQDSGLASPHFDRR